MQLSRRLREELWGARDWAARLVTLAHDVRAAPLTPPLAEWALELATACEAIVPSRGTAIEMYVTAWKAAQAHPHALARARFLCREIGNLELAAKIARLEYKHSKNPEYQLLEGLAWLDAQNPDRALRPLLSAAKANRSDPVVERALAIARREWTDVRGQIAKLEAAAAEATDPRTASGLFLDAARIAGMIATDSAYGDLLIAAFHKNPLDESVHDLVMQRLGKTRDYSRLEDLIEVWAAAAKSVQQQVDLYRRLGLDESLSANKPEFAARMVYEALRIAYRHAVPEIPGHLAMLAHLRAVLERSSIDRLLSVFRIAIQRDQSDDERLWFAINGLDVAWNRLQRADEALPYAKIVRDYAPAHSILQDYVSGGGFQTADGVVSAPPVKPAPITATLVPPVTATPAPPVAAIPVPPVTPMSAPPDVDAPHLRRDPAVIDLNALGDGHSMPSIPLPPNIDVGGFADAPPPIDLPIPQAGTRSALETSSLVELVPPKPAPEKASAAPIDPSFLFEPVPPPLPPPDVSGGAEESELELDGADELVLDDDDVMLLDDEDVQPVEEHSEVPLVPMPPPAAAPTAAAPRVPRPPAPPPGRRDAGSEGAGPPPPPRSYAPGFAPPSKIPSIPFVKKPTGKNGR